MKMWWCKRCGQLYGRNGSAYRSCARARVHHLREKAIKRSMDWVNSAEARAGPIMLHAPGRAPLLHDSEMETLATGNCLLEKRDQNAALQIGTNSNVDYLQI